MKGEGGPPVEPSGNPFGFHSGGDDETASFSFRMDLEIQPGPPGKEHLGLQLEAMRSFQFYHPPNVESLSHF
jgi:hypothetical protein